MFESIKINYYKSAALGRRKNAFSNACRRIAQTGSFDSACALIEIFTTKQNISIDQKREIVQSLSNLQDEIIPALKKYSSSIAKDIHFFISIMPHKSISGDFLFTLGIPLDTDDIIAFLGDIKYSAAFALVSKTVRNRFHPSRLIAMSAVIKIDKLKATPVLKDILLNDEGMFFRRAAAEMLLSSSIPMNDDEYMSAMILTGRFEEAFEDKKLFENTLKSVFPGLDKRAKLDALSFAATNKIMLPLIESSLSSADEEIRMFACRMYSSFENIDSARIVSMLNDSDTNVRNAASGAILSDCDKFIPAIMSIIETSIDSGISLFYLTSIENTLIGMGRKIIPHMKRLLEKNNSSALLAAEVLSEIDDDEIFGIMNLLADNDNPAIRQIAVEYLGNMKNPELFDKLSTYTTDKNPQVRKTAYDSLILSDIIKAENFLKELSPRLDFDDKTYLKNILSELSRVH
ncbi:MAG: HEAT repeat domain-containing protein [Spirochaetes bacterium]|nr:HEAT repeat domain-containing protein [Spirochaetota bacterium]